MANAQPINEPSAPVDDWTYAAEAIVALAHRDPELTWRTSELVNALEGFEVLAVVRAVAELHRSGDLERVSVATYRAPTAPPEVTAARNDLMVWGDAS